MKHKASSNLPYSVQSSSRTGMEKSDQTSMDGASNAATVASKKPQQKGNTPSMDPAKPPSALANQEVKNIPRSSERDVPGRAGAAMAQAAGGEATEAPYAKVRELPMVPAVEPHSCCLAEPPARALGVSVGSAVTAAQLENPSTAGNTPGGQVGSTGKRCWLRKILEWQKLHK